MAELKAFPFPNNVEYGYYEYKPEGATNILIFVHGHGERGNGHSELSRVLKIGIPRLINEGKWQDVYPFNQFIIIAPQYPVKAANMYPDTLKSFIEKMCVKHGIAMDRVYMVGISGGAISVLNYIVKFNHVKAALAIAGQGNTSLAAKAKNTKVWLVHGEDDTVVKVSGSKNFVDAYNKANPPVPAKFDPIPNYGHEGGVWDRAVSRPKYYEFMLK
jgi:predicted peptidase